MKHKIVMRIGALILMFAITTNLFSQNITRNTYWNNCNQGRDTISNSLFEALLQKTISKKMYPEKKIEFYSIGYLKDIEFYYVSYTQSDESSTDYITELFKINKFTNITNFDYTGSSTMLNDSNKNHCVIKDIGKIDLYETYLIFYDKKHISIYKKNDTKNEYDLLTDYYCATKNENFKNSQVSYDTRKHQFSMKVKGLEGHAKGYVETYEIKDGKIKRIK